MQPGGGLRDGTGCPGDWAAFRNAGGGRGPGRCLRHPGGGSDPPWGDPGAGRAGRRHEHLPGPGPARPAADPQRSRGGRPVAPPGRHRGGRRRPELVPEGVWRPGGDLGGAGEDQPLRPAGQGCGAGASRQRRPGVPALPGRREKSPVGQPCQRGVLRDRLLQNKGPFCPGLHGRCGLFPAAQPGGCPSGRGMDRNSAGHGRGCQQPPVDSDKSRCHRKAHSGAGIGRRHRLGRGHAGWGGRGRLPGF